MSDTTNKWTRFDVIALAIIFGLIGGVIGLLGGCYLATSDWQTKKEESRKECRQDIEQASKAHCPETMSEACERKLKDARTVLTHAAATVQP